MPFSFKQFYLDSRNVRVQMQDSLGIRQITQNSLINQMINQSYNNPSTASHLQPKSVVNSKNMPMYIEYEHNKNLPRKSKNISSSENITSLEEKKNSTLQIDATKNSNDVINKKGSREVVVGNSQLDFYFPVICS